MSASANFFLSSRSVLFQLLTRKCPVVCFNAKDFVRTVLQFFGDDGCWKRGKSEPGPECRRLALAALRGSALHLWGLHPTRGLSVRAELNG